MKVERLESWKVEGAEAMKQVVQNLKSGRIGVEEVPAPAAEAFGAPGVLVETVCSLISPGTERAAVELGKSSLLGKAMQRPDQVKKVLANLRREGLAQTVQKVQQRLDVTRAMGYSCAGTVLEARGCEIFSGTRVACVGTDAATHAEINFVPRNLCAAIPEGVSFEEASFVALGGIALHAEHLSSRGVGSAGENVAVLGLGPVGLLLAQVLRASGCRVAGFDLREDRMEIARQLGFEHVAKADRSSLQETLRGWGIFRGFARVFITAASKSAEPVEWAVEAAADRATLVVVGDVRTDLPRNACYAKELTVVYARSYGPGRYDPAYEEGGEDYPLEQVRWSLRRNLEEFLSLLAKKQIAVAPLITHRFAVDDVARAYEVVSNGKAASLGVLLQYSMAERKPTTTLQLAPLAARKAGTISVGVIGAGSYAKTYLLPTLKSDSRVRLVSVANARGVSAKKAGEEFGFARCTTDANDVFRDAEIDAVIIATRHRWHAALAAEAIAAGKTVFLEKPMCLNEEELERIVAAHARNPVPFMLGHNRRFAPATRALAEFFAGARPLNIRYTVHAGPLPENHWLRDPAQGGRILGEVCHFVDWCRTSIGAPLTKITATRRGELLNEDVNAVLDFADGSVATIAYDCLAPADVPKEHIEISAAGRTAALDDFARATFVSEGRQKTGSFRGKGQAEMVAAFLAGVKSGRMPVAFEEWVASARATLLVASGEKERAKIEKRK
jgi:predicted dehydrogenase/threonine dehydrogenase-like Zn-dependent dehydrogenase